jgi:hypothetical protein
VNLTPCDRLPMECAGDHPTISHIVVADSKMRGIFPHCKRGRGKSMTINEAITNAVKEGYRVSIFKGVEMYYSGANTEWVVWTRQDNDSSFMRRVEETFIDPTFWQALTRALYRADIYPSGDWKSLWHQFIDSLINGKTPELFFKHISPHSRRRRRLLLTLNQ